MARQIPPRDEADIDVLFVKNVSGGDLVAGTAVMATITSDDADHVGGLTVIPCTVAGQYRFVGIVLGRTCDDSGQAIPDDGFGYVVRRGVVPVAVPVEDSIAVAAGASLFISNVDAGELTDAAATGEGTRVVAVALAAAASDEIPASGVLVLPA